MSRTLSHCLPLLLLAVLPLYGQAQSQLQVSDEPNPSNLWVIATASEDYVRVTALGVVQRIRLEVLRQRGERVYDSDFQPGSTIEWAVTDQDSHPLLEGYYGCLVTVEDLAGRVSPCGEKTRTSCNCGSLDGLET